MDSTLTYSIMYLEINLVSVFIVAFIHYKTRGLTKMVAQRNFTMAIDAEMIFFLSDTFYVCMRYGLFPSSPALALLFKEVYFLCTSLVCFFWFVYFEYLQETPFVKNSKRIWASSTLVWLMVAILIINIPTGICFGFDDNGDYHRGPLFIVLYIISYVYVFFTCARALLRLFNKQYYSQRTTLLRLALFPVAPAAAGIIQFIHPELPVACAVLSFVTFVIYSDWTEQMISVDPLTHLHNRKMLEYYYEQWRDNKESGASLYLLMVDANRFKSINDNYGHIEGDKALIRIADGMRLALRGHNRRFNIARYGGDEFAILVWCDSESDIKMLKDRINDSITELNEEASAPYELSVSIGYEKAEHDMSLKDLIGSADKYLYDAKAAYNK